MQALKASLVKGTIKLLSCLSLRGMQRVGIAIGYISWLSKSELFRVTAINLQLCYPKLPKETRKVLVKRSLIETGKSIAEAGAVWGWRPQACLNKVVNVSGEQYLEKALADKNGLVILLPHLGNWEIFLLYCSNRFPIVTMFKEPRIKGVAQLIKKSRERLGNTLVPTTAKGLMKIAKTLTAGGTTIMLPDQEPENLSSGEFVPFFGIKSLTMSLASRLVETTGANVICGYAERLPNGKGFEIVFKPAHGVINKDINKSVTAVNTVIEKCVREIPEQYQWEYKRFKQWHNDPGKTIKIYSTSGVYKSLKDIDVNEAKDER